MDHFPDCFGGMEDGFWEMSRRDIVEKFCF